MSMALNNLSVIGYYSFDVIPRAIIQDVIFREISELGDIARLEVAAAIHHLHDEEKVS
jgi:hypothetical protein